MNRGTVMETGNGKAIVLTPDGEFVRITAHRNLAIGDEISWTESQLAPYRRRLAFHRTRWISAAAATAAVIVLLFGIWSFRTPPVVAYVSMDINPSVEFGLDSQERVRELRAVNDDALPYIEGVAYKGKPIENVMEILARKLTESHLLNAGDGEIVIASVRLKSVDMKWEEQVTDKIERILLQVSRGAGDESIKTGSLDIEKLYLPVEVREEAQANGISSGKMAFWLAAENKGHEVPLSSLQQESLKQIASSWGGLKQVLDDNKDHDGDKETWKKLLADQKENKKQRNKEKHSPSPAKEQPAASSPPRASSDDRSDHQDKDHQNRDGNGNDHPEDDDKQQSDDKKKHEQDKQKNDDDKRQSRDDEKKSSSDDREKSKPNKQRDKRDQDNANHRQNDHRDNNDYDHRDRNGKNDQNEHGD